MTLFGIFFFLFLTGKIQNCHSLSIKEQNLLSVLFQDLSIKNFIIVKYDSLDLKNGDLNLIKRFARLNIYIHYMNFKELSEFIGKYGSLEKEKWTYEPKTFILFDDYKIFDELPNILNERYFKLLKLGIWAMFHSQEFNIENFENDIYIPYNCQFFVIKLYEKNVYRIFEYYNMKKDQKEFYINEFAYFDVLNGLIVSEPDFDQRRFDMNQSVMELATEFPDPQEFCQDSGNCAFHEIVNDMSKMMNFKPFKIILSESDQLDFRYNHSHYWELSLDIDVWVSHILFNRDFRNDVGPLWKIPAFCYIKYNKSYEESTPYFTRPLSTDFWLSIIVWLIVSSVSVLLVDYFWNVKIFKGNFILSDSLFRQFESCTNQSGNGIPRNISSRLTAIITRSLFVIVSFFFSGSLLSFLCAPPPSLVFPFTDLEGFAHDGSFKFYFLHPWFDFTFDYSHDDVLHKISDKFIDDKQPKYLNETLALICEDSKNAYLTFNSSEVKLFDGETCELLEIPKTMFFAWVRVMVDFDCPYRKIFNRILKSFGSAGVLKKMEKAAIGASTKFVYDEKSLKPVEFDSLLSIFVFLAYSHLTAVIVLFLERLWFFLRKMKKDNNEFIFDIHFGFFKDFTA